MPFGELKSIFRVLKWPLKLKRFGILDWLWAVVGPWAASEPKIEGVNETSSKHESEGFTEKIKVRWVRNEKVSRKKLDFLSHEWSSQDEGFTEKLHFWAQEIRWKCVGLDVRRFHEKKVGFFIPWNSSECVEFPRRFHGKNCIFEPKKQGESALRLIVNS